MVGTVGSLLGYAPTPHHEQTERWFHEGNLHEQDIVDQVMAGKGEYLAKKPKLVTMPVASRPTAKFSPGRNIQVVGRQAQIQLPIEGTNVVLVGHLDGIESNGDPFESKTVGQWTWDNKVHREKKDPDIERWVKGDMAYAYQAQTYIEGLGAEGIWYAVKNRNNGKILWTHMDFPLAVGAPGWRVQQILEWVDKGVIPPCDGGCNSYMSEWWHIHERKPARPVVQVKVEKIEQMVKQYKEYSQQERDLKKKKTAIKEELQPMLSEGVWQTESGTVTVEDRERKFLSREKLEEKFGKEAVKECEETKTYPGSIEIR